MIHEFRLSPPKSGHGVSCDEEGAFIGTIPLLKRSLMHGKDRWEPRDCGELSKQLGKQFGLPIDISSKIGGIKAISNALNEGNVARAQIAAVLLGIPDPPPPLSKRTRSRADMIRFIRDLDWSGLLKFDWDPDEHPRWPAGAPDSQGGQFAPKSTQADSSYPVTGAVFADDTAHGSSGGTQGYQQIADIEPEADEPEPEVNGQTETESRAASEIDNAAGEALLREKAAEAAGEDTKESSQSRIDRNAFARERAQYWKNEAAKDPVSRQLPPETYTEANLARMRDGKPPIGEDGFPLELHHPDGLPWKPLEPMTRTGHRLGPNYLFNHPWLGGDDQ